MKRVKGQQCLPKSLFICCFEVAFSACSIAADGPASSCIVNSNRLKEGMTVKAFLAGGDDLAFPWSLGRLGDVTGYDVFRVIEAFVRVSTDPVEKAALSLDRECVKVSDLIQLLGLSSHPTYQALH